MKSDTTPSKGEQTRQAILTAAYSLIIQQGYAATSMRQIAAKSGLALGSIYNHFASKDDVFRAIVEEHHPLFRMLPLLSSVEGSTAEEFVRNAAQTLVGELRRHPEFLNLMLVEIVEFKGGHGPLLFKKIYPQLMPIAQRLAGLGGDVDPIPPLVLARAFLGMFISYYITEMLIGRAVPAELRRINTMDHFVDIFLHGILDKEAP